MKNRGSASNKPGHALLFTSHWMCFCAVGSEMWAASLPVYTLRSSLCTGSRSEPICCWESGTRWWSAPSSPDSRCSPAQQNQHVMWATCCSHVGAGGVDSFRNDTSTHAERNRHHVCRNVRRLKLQKKQKLQLVSAVVFTHFAAQTAVRGSWQFN